MLLSVVPAKAQPVTLNLKNADLQAVIATVSEMTGKNFVVDPRVKGKVTVISSQPMNADEIYQVFLSVLSVHGFAAVPGGDGVIKVVPEINAKQSAIPTVTAARPGEGEQYVTRVIKVHKVDATQLVPLLRPLLPQQGHLAAYSPGNLLIASAEAANLERLAAIVRRVDRAGDEGIEVIHLQHASATEVVRILQTLETATKGQNQASIPTLVADERTNSVLLNGAQSARLRLRAIIADLDTPLENNTGNTAVIYLNYGDAKQIAQVLTGISKGLTIEAKGATATQANQVTIQADDSTNALVITAPPDVMNSLRSVVRRLDIRRAQVLVEGIIAEITTDKAKELGVQWAFDGRAKNQPVGVINFAGSGSGLANLLTSPPTVSDGITLGIGDTTNTGGTRIGALLRALASDSNTNILSTPSLVTLDNQEAEIVVGQNVPFITGSYTSIGSSGSTPTNPFQTIERKDVGLTLKIKPQINEGNAVKMDVVQEVSSLRSGTSGAADIITDKRSLKTSVLVDDGQILVLGGLIDDTLRESVEKVPGLGDIPILGHLFSYRNTTKAKRDLMIFLHPTILRSPQQNTLVSGGKYELMRARQLEVRQHGVSLMPSENSPLMPKWDDALSLPPPFHEQTPGAGLPPTEATPGK